MQFKSEQLMVLDALYFQKNQGLWKLASAITQKSIIQPNYSGERY